MQSKKVPSVSGLLVTIVGICRSQQFLVLYDETEDLGRNLSKRLSGHSLSVII